MRLIYLTRQNCPVISGLLVASIAVVFLTINSLFFHFSGNNYLPYGSIPAGFSLLLTLYGLRLCCDTNTYLYQLVQIITSLYFAMALIALLTNAVQYTPFPIIDSQLIALEKFLHIDMADIVAWTAQFSYFQKTLVYIYDGLVYQMILIPVLLACFAKFSILREYICLMLISALIGFSIYYFFPTVAPASMIQSPFFSLEQHATGLKFTQIHNHQIPTTMAGGMIAFPSFHAIWAWLCLYVVRGWRILFTLLLPINILLIASCVLLGWHYPIDIVGSALVMLITHTIYHCLSKTSQSFVVVPKDTSTLDL